jgi:hypothetical protein
MGLQTIVQGAFDVIKAAVPDCVAEVNVDGDTANGIIDTRMGQAELDGPGQRGVTRRTVRVNASEIAAPEIGQTITVAGLKAIATGIRRDPVEAVMVIEYQLTSEAE